MTASVPIERLLDALTQVSRAVKQAGHRMDGTDASMRISDMALAGYLAANGESRIGDVACALRVTPSVASRQIATMEGEGLITRRADPADGRAGLVELTPRGRERVAETKAAFARRLQGYIPDWDGERIDEVAATLTELAGRLLSSQPATV